jgi:hypothetical protein
MLQQWMSARVPPLIAVATFGALVTCFVVDRHLYETLLILSGVPPVHLPGEAPWQPSWPFFDTHFLLAQLQCWRRGVNVYVVNPCDAIGRLHDYSPLWLRFSFIPTGAAWLVPLGLTLDTVFLAALFLLPPLPPRRPAERVLLTFGIVSTASIFAMERGNTDLLIFAMCVLAARLLVGAMPKRMAGYGVIMVAAALKFYPIVMLVIALRERGRTFLAVVAASIVGVLLFAFWFGAETGRALGNTGVSYFGGMWGAAGLPFGAAFLVQRALPGMVARHPVLDEALTHWGPPSAFAAAVVVAVALAARLATRHDFARGFAVLPPLASTFLVTGTALTVGCFLAHQNIDYRAVVLLLALPGLLALACVMPPGSCRTLVWASAVAAVMLAWDPPGLLSSSAPPGWLLRQYVWWAHVTVGMGVLLRFALQSPAYAWLQGRSTVTGAPHHSLAASAAATPSSDMAATAMSSAECDAAGMASTRHAIPATMTTSIGSACLPVTTVSASLTPGRSHNSIGIVPNPRRSASTATAIE